MDINNLKKINDYTWKRGPIIFYGSESLITHMDEKVLEQITHVAQLPGLVGSAMTMPDAHWGYGFPIGGVAAFDADRGGVISAGGGGYDISCGVRCLHTGLTTDDIRAVQKELADFLFYKIPAGVGSTGAIRLGASDTD